MATYEYRCEIHGGFLTQHPLGEAPEVDVCSMCEDEGRFAEWPRVFSVGAIMRPMHEHWNPTTGQPVSSMKQFRDQLKQKSEEAEARTGIPTNFEPMDMTPAEYAKTLDDGGETGLRDTHDGMVKRGEKDPTPKLI